MVNPGARVVADLYQYEDGKKQLSANIQNVLSGDNETGSAYDGEYRIDDEKTTKGIDNVTVDNNTVDIYLVEKTREGGSEQAKRSYACTAGGSEQTKRSCDTDKPIQADRSEPADGLFAADNISRARPLHKAAVGQKPQTDAAAHRR